MLFDPVLAALAVPAVVLAGLSKGGFGSGVAFAAVPILALGFEPGFALGLMLPLLMLMDLSALKLWWGKWDRRAAVILILGAVPGLVLGALFQTAADPDHLRFLIGAIALAFVAWQLSGADKRLRLSVKAGPWIGGFFGLLAGFTSFVSHAGGPAVAIWLLSQRNGTGRMAKGPYQATTVLVFFIINLIKAPVYFGLGLFGADTLLPGLWLAPIALAAVYLGAKLHDIVPEKVFFAITYATLTLTGVKLLFDGIA